MKEEERRFIDVTDEREKRKILSEDEVIIPGSDIEYKNIETYSGMKFNDFIKYFEESEIKLVDEVYKKYGFGAVNELLMIIECMIDSINSLFIFDPVTRVSKYMGSENSEEVPIVAFSMKAGDTIIVDRLPSIYSTAVRRIRSDKALTFDYDKYKQFITDTDIDVNKTIEKIYRLTRYLPDDQFDIFDRLIQEVSWPVFYNTVLSMVESDDDSSTLSRQRYTSFDLPGRIFCIIFDFMPKFIHVPKVRKGIDITF